MTDWVLAHTPEWLGYFTSRGHDPQPLAAGVEGAIYDLGNDLVAKVWRDREMTSLAETQAFYADLAAAGLPFRTPEILSIEQVSGRSVTYERKLPGRQLQDRLGEADHRADPAAARCVTEVLRALATVPATPAMRQLAFLDEQQPLWAGAADFLTALTSLVRRRADRFGPVIRERLPDFDQRLAALTERLCTIAIRPDAAIHGDLVAANILVDEQARPVALLDFGFLTTAGDPALDAAIAAAILNMYGPHAAAITDELTASFAAGLGYPAETLLLYQAAYAVATANAFTADGSDGHFSWCVDQLRRPAVAGVLGM